MGHSISVCSLATIHAGRFVAVTAFASQSTFDLRGVAESLRMRWWIVAVSLVIAVVAVFIQESNANAPTDGYLVTVYQSYEAKIETSALQIAQVDPSSVVPYPSFESQLGVLQSAETATEMAEVAGVDAAVAVSRSEPKFTMVDTLDEADNRVTFLSRGTTSYNFMCRAKNAADCSSVIDAYVKKTSELRTLGTIGGLEGGQKLIANLIEKGIVQLAELRASGAPDSSVDAQELKLVELRTKSNALAFTVDGVSGKLEFAGESIIEDGASASFVQKSSYLYGAIFGLILGLLIVAQLGISDKKVRNKRQLQRLIPYIAVLGDISGGEGLQEGIATVVATARAQSNTVLRLVGMSDATKTTAMLEQEFGKQSLSCTTLPMFSALSADVLLAPANSAMLFVVVKGVDRLDAVQHATSAAQLAGNHLLGVLLHSAE